MSCSSGIDFPPWACMDSGVAHELYPIAVRQARQSLISDLLAAVVVVIAAVLMWLGGWPGFWCFVVSSLGVEQRRFAASRVGDGYVGCAPWKQRQPASCSTTTRN